MAAEQPLYLLLFWHQHQPLYKDGLKNRYEMPWVRLHATKDYFDMVAVLEEFPKVKANFNLVPSLLMQLDDYAQNRAEDRFLEATLKTPDQLTFDDRQFLLQNFFMANWEHMIDPYPRYRELLEKRGRHAGPDTFARTQSYFKAQDWMDLQTWFNLTWFDPWWREQDSFIRDLFEKGKNFTDDDKKTLIQRQREICGQIVDKHKAAQAKGQIEVTTTPLYHPILPLLCDSDTAKVALPHATLPAPKFRHPEDAQTQLRRAVDDYTSRFGQRPRGLWPSEGSVSEEALSHILDAGIEWIATDEGILANSVKASPFKHEDIYRPYRYQKGDKSLHVFFRDHELSDAIGFVYATWDAQAAAKDFIKKLRQRKANWKDADPMVVSVVLDGENCWEYYAQDGLPFLRALYGELAKATDIVTVRGSDIVSLMPQALALDMVWPGSWINSNFAIWIGHPEDNAAWTLLRRTRQDLIDELRLHPDLQDRPETQQAWEEIYIAEGSDWCWWYGDDHSSANDGAFDYLFRKHLMNVYTLMGEKIPDDLRIPIKRHRQTQLVTEPVDFVTPTLDGKVSGYFEWRSAGVYHTPAAGTGTMQKAENLIKSLYYGFDMQNIYFRLDLNHYPTAESLKNWTLLVDLQTSDKNEFLLSFENNGSILSTRPMAARPESVICGNYGKIIEFALRLKDLNGALTDGITATLTLLVDKLEQERWPNESRLKIPSPTESTFAYNWQV